MTVFWAMLLRPFLYIIFIAPFVALAVWLVRWKMPDGKLKRFLLWPGKRSGGAAYEARSDQAGDIVRK
jgi:hypothetical protein